jgi:hypothetical protein
MKDHFIPGLFLAGTLFFAYLYVVGPIDGDPNESTLSVERKAGSIPYNRVQNLKQQTSLRMGLEKERALLDQSQRRANLQAGQNKATPYDPTFQEDAGPAAYDVDNKRSYEALTLDQRMDEFLAKRQQYEELEKIKREEYVDQFIMEARSMGFDVKVGSDMKIKSVKKIKSK